MVDIATQIEKLLRKKKRVNSLWGGIALFISIMVLLFFGWFFKEGVDPIQLMIILLIISLVFSLRAKMPIIKQDNIACASCGENLQPYIEKLSLTGTENRKLSECLISPGTHDPLLSSFNFCPNCGVSLRDK